MGSVGGEGAGSPGRGLTAGMGSCQREAGPGSASRSAQPGLSPAPSDHPTPLAHPTLIHQAIFCSSFSCRIVPFLPFLIITRVSLSQRKVRLVGRLRGKAQCSLAAFRNQLSLSIYESTDDGEGTFEVSRLPGTSAPSSARGGLGRDVAWLRQGGGWGSFCPTPGVSPASRMEPGQGQLSLTLTSFSFLPDLPEQPGSVLGPECASCKRVFSSYFRKEPVYQLPCGHLLCRPCLGEKQHCLPVACTACQQPFASQDVLRVHL